MITLMTVVFLLLIYLPLTLLVSGFTIMTLWNWFIVPLFPQVAVLTLVPALGLGLVVGYLTHQTPGANDDKSKDQKAMELTYPFIRAGLVLLVGYILKFHIS